MAQRSPFLAFIVIADGDRFEDEQVLRPIQAVIGNAAFDIGKAFADERRLNFRGWLRR